MSTTHARTGTSPAPYAGRSREAAVPRAPALVAGLGLLLMAVLAGVAQLVVIGPALGSGDGAGTTADLLAGGTVVRAAVVAMLVVAALDVLVAWALFLVLRPWQEDLARLAAWLRTCYAAVLTVAVAQLVVALDLAERSTGASGAEAAVLEQAVAQQAAGYEAVWGLGLGLFGLHLVVLGVAVARSGVLPRWLGALVGVAGVGYVVDCVGSLLAPDLTWQVGSVTFVGEVVLLVALLVTAARR